MRVEESKAAECSPQGVRADCAPEVCLHLFYLLSLLFSIVSPDSRIRHLTVWAECLLLIPIVHS